MRTSNKILAGTFLAILLIITGIHVALYAKYKRSDFTTMESLHEERFESYPLNDIKSVSLTGLQNVLILSSDTARLEIEKGGYRKLSHQFVNGVLTIKGDTTESRANGSAERIRSYQEVIIYLPVNQTIQADFCEIRIKGAEDSLKAPSISADMTETTLHFGSWESSDKAPGRLFNKISITKFSRGSIDVSQNSTTKELSADLESSNFDDNNASINYITIRADGSSSVKLSGKNISKAKFALP